MKKNILIISTLFSLLFLSCGSDIAFSVQNDGSVKTTMSCQIGNATYNLLKSFQEDSTKDVFDPVDLQVGLESALFYQVSVKHPKDNVLFIDATDKGNSILFSSKLLSVENDAVKITINPLTLKNLYTQCDDSLVSFLDLLLAPVFNDEIMTPEEYYDVLTSFYGEEVADELKACSIKFYMKQKNGSIRTYTIPLLKILSIQDDIII